MVDRPHLVRARRTLDAAAELAARDGAQTTI
jgi:hypothetical protein